MSNKISNIARVIIHEFTAIKTNDSVEYDEGDKLFPQKKSDRDAQIEIQRSISISTVQEMEINHFTLPTPPMWARFRGLFPNTKVSIVKNGKFTVEKTHKQDPNQITETGITSRDHVPLI